MRNFTFVTKSMLPMAKLMFGIGKPWKERILGTELAGEIVEVGKDVTRFKSGDQVFGSTGMAGGGHAQYACLHENAALAIKPDSLNWEDAPAGPPCGHIGRKAWTFLATNVHVLVTQHSNHEDYDEDKGPGNSAPQVLKTCSFFDPAGCSAKWLVSPVPLGLVGGPGASLLQAPR